MNYIIDSLLDLDFYKLTMGQFGFHRYPNVPVEYRLINRTKYAHLGRFVSEFDLRTELDHVEDLRFSEEELQYLENLVIGGKQIFQKDYLNYLKNFRMPPYQLKRAGEDYELIFWGLWSEAIYWETIALSIVNELYYRSLSNHLTQGGQKALRENGLQIFIGKSNQLNFNKEVQFSDFGTRRRFSREWHESIVKLSTTLLRDQLLGTSNVLLAKILNLLLVGTIAHEVFMAMSRICRQNDEDIINSHNRVYDEWWDEYGESLSIALTDTYGSDFTFRTFGRERARKWKGLRQDSGNPISFGEKAIKFYEGHGIDPREKTIVFSDGLDVDAMIRIANHFQGRIKIVFGWGTNLTNDLGFKPLSLVVKVTKANGRGTVKLSDNLAKAMGKYEDVERFKKIFGYTDLNYEECKY